MKLKISELIVFTILLLVSFVAGCSTIETSRNAPANTSHVGHAGTNAPNNTSNTNHGATEHGEHAGQSGMDHANMQSSPDAASATYDQQFLDTMIAHHQGAVDMARMSDEHAAHNELKTLSLSIIADQEREIRQMREWRERWYAGRPPAVNMELRGMRESMQGMDMARLGAARGNDFDLMFVQQMIPHHEGAVTMAREALERAEHAEIRIGRTDHHFTTARNRSNAPMGNRLEIET